MKMIEPQIESNRCNTNRIVWRCDYRLCMVCWSLELCRLLDLQAYSAFRWLRDFRSFSEQNLKDFVTGRDKPYALALVILRTFALSIVELIARSAIVIKGREHKATLCRGVIVCQSETRLSQAAAALLQLHSPTHFRPPSQHLMRC